MWTPWGKPPDPKEISDKWKTELKSQIRILDRQIRSIEREEQKVKKSIQTAAKRGDTDSARMLAKELIRSKKAKERIHNSKAQINSVITSLKHQQAQLKVCGHLQKSAQVMQHMNNLVKVQDVAQTMQNMSKEMVKMGIMEEMIDDVFEDQDADLEDEADEEVDKVMMEITSGMLDKPGLTPRNNEKIPQAQEKEEEEEEEDLGEMRARLDALKSL